MKVIDTWQDEKKRIELLHESGKHDQKGHWEYRVDGEVRMYGEGTPRGAREAVCTRRKLLY